MIPDSFPNEQVYKAYIYPNVNRYDERFQWEPPQMDMIRTYCRNKLGWTDEEVPSFRSFTTPGLHFLIILF